MKKRILSLLTVLLMLFAFAPCVHAAEIVDSGECGAQGDNVTWTLDSDGTLTISGTGEMSTYSWNGSPFYNNGNIKSVIIDYGVTSIGSWAFEKCDGLISITIPDSVTSINYGAFSGCSNFTSIEIPDSVSIIAESAFSGCSGLTSITILNGVRIIGNLSFSGCSSLTSITIPNSVTNIGDRTFSGCSSLASMHVDGMNKNYCSIDGNLFSKDKKTFVQYAYGKRDKSYTIPDSVTSIGNWAFENCNSLTSITIPDSVTSINYGAFSGCSKLTSITIPDSITNIGNSAFMYCDSLTNITIPDSVTNIGEDAFSFCKGLTSIIILEGVASIRYRAFYDCSNLTSITIPNSVTSINGWVFEGCRGLVDVYYAGSEEDWNNIDIQDGNDPLLNAKIYFNSTNSEHISGFYTYEVDEGKATITKVDKTISGSVIIPSELGGYPVVNIGESAFSDCDKIVALSMPDTITNIGSYAFSGCTALKQIKLSENLEMLAYSVFHSCSSLEKIYIPDNTEINYYNPMTGSLFVLCENLKSIEVSETNSRYISQDGILFNKDKTTLIAYPPGRTETKYCVPSGVTTVGAGAFQTCERLEEIILQNGVRLIDASATDCKGLKKMVIPKSVSEIGPWQCWDNVEIYFEGNETEWNALAENYYQLGNYHAYFGYDYSIVDSGKCGDNLTWTLNNDGVLTISGMGEMYNYNYRGWETDAPWFAYKDQIKSLVVTDGVTSVGQNAFFMCEKLAEISLPKSIEYIGEYAFDYTEFFDDMKNWEDDLLYIGNYLIAHGGEKTSFVIKEGTEYIGEYSLCKTYYDYIVIPASVKYIGEGAFYGCDISTIYYLGSEENWNNIEIQNNNDSLINANIQYLNKINVTYIVKDVVWKQEAAIKITTDKPVRLGYKFLGWATEHNAAEVQYQPGDEIDSDMDNITLYAVWEKVSYTVTSKINGIFIVTPTGVPVGSKIMIACYKNNKLVYMSEYDYDGSYVIPFYTNAQYDKAKVFVWDSMKNMVPITEAEAVK